MRCPLCLCLFAFVLYIMILLFYLKYELVCELTLYKFAKAVSNGSLIICTNFILWMCLYRGGFARPRWPIFLLRVAVLRGTNEVGSESRRAVRGVCGEGSEEVRAGSFAFLFSRSWELRYVCARLPQWHSISFITPINYVVMIVWLYWHWHKSGRFWFFFKFSHVTIIVVVSCNSIGVSSIKNKCWNLFLCTLLSSWCCY